MRQILRPSVVLLALLSLGLQLSASTFPRRRGRRPPKVSWGGAMRQRGPQYSAAPTGSLSPQQVQQQLDQSRNPVNQIAAEEAGLASSGACDTSAITRLQAITAELNSILAQMQAANAGLYSCNYLDTACISYYSNLALTLANRAAVLGNESLSLAGAAQAAYACMAKGSGAPGIGINAMPAGLTYANLAQRFNVPLAGALGGLGGFSSPTLDQLLQDVDQGRIPDYDGRQARQNKALGAYEKALAATAGLGAKVEAGREFADKPVKDFSDPDAAAQQEYLRINYEVLGPKYASLAKDRSEKADAYAQQVLNSPPDLPLPSQEKPVIEADEEGLSKKLADGMAEEGQTAVEDALTKGMSPSEKALVGIAKIDQAVSDGLGELADALPKALADLGSPSLAHDNVDAWMAKQDKVFGDVAKTSQEAASEIAGGNPNPENATKSAVRGWIKQWMGVGGDD